MTSFSKKPVELPIMMVIARGIKTPKLREQSNEPSRPTNNEDDDNAVCITKKSTGARMQKL